MPDGLSMRMLGISETRAQFVRIDSSVDRATMWTVRQVGRKAKQYAKAGAPVYTGPARDRWVGGTKVGPIGKGDLKKSIHSAKRLKKPAPGAYTNTVSPRGIPNVYAGKQEARTPFMAPAKDRAASEAPAIAEGAYRRATAWRR